MRSHLSRGTAFGEAGQKAEEAMPTAQPKKITSDVFMSDPAPWIARARNGQVTHIVAADGEVFVLGMNGARSLSPPEFDLPDLDLLEAAIAKAPKINRWLR
jgi:hypothetical protein